MNTKFQGAYDAFPDPILK